MIDQVWINFVVLGFAAVFEGATWWFGWKAFSRVRKSRPFWSSVVASKDPASFMVLFEDSAALIGIAIAAVATFVSWKYRLPWVDGAGSILIGAVLAIVSVLLARESKELLIGERASPAFTKDLRETAMADPCVIDVVKIATTQMAPDQVIAAMSVEIEQSLNVPQLEKLIGRIEKEMHKKFPQLFRIFIRPVPPKTKP
jgi:divalent metal cation (Fe/Co/Zn/Cd) transporter